MKRIATLLALLVTSISWAQITFRSEYGFPMSAVADGSMIQTSDGGLAFAGMTNANPHLIKLGTGGNIQWQKEYQSLSITAASTLLESLNCYYLLGIGSDSSSNNYYYILKTDSSGNVIWSKQYAVSSTLWLQSAGYSFITSGYGYDIGVKAEVLGDGSIVFVGYAQDMTSPDSYVQVTRVDTAGNLQWTRQVYSGKVKGYDIEILHDGIKGGNDKIYILSDNSYKPTLTEFDPLGNEIWTKYYNGNIVRLGTLQVTSDYGIVIVGKYNVNSSFDLYIQKTDTAGVTLWSNSYDLNSDEWGGGTSAVAGGGLVICGGHSPGWGNATPTLYRIDAAGNLVWCRSYTNPGKPESDFESVVTCSDSGFACVGITGSLMSGYKFYIVKTDPLGNSNCNDTVLQPPTLQLTSNPLNLIPAITGVLTPTPIIFTPQASLLVADNNCLTTAVSTEHAEAQIGIYPVPSSGIITINGIEGCFQKEIFNTLGQLVKTIPITETSSELDLSDLPSGNYFLKLSTETMIYTRKIVIVH